VSEAPGASHRLRIGFAAPYFTLVEPQMPDGFRQQRRDQARAWAALLEADFDVIDGGLITSAEDGIAAGGRFDRAQVDAIVLAPVMVAPPGYALQALPDEAPVVLWTVPGAPRLPDDLRPSQAAANSMQAGVAMIANALHRRGRTFAAAAAATTDSPALSRLIRVIRGAATAGRLRQAVALRIGEPVDGYLDVESTSEQLGRLGVRERSLDRRALERAFEAVEPAAAIALLDELKGLGWALVDHPLLEHSARLAAALAELAHESRVVCGTVNCHGPCFRTNELVGVPACLGVSVLTERGVPFSCTGDQPVALALLIAKLLSGAALYCEVNSAEADTGLALLSAGGEGDPSWRARASTVTVAPNEFFPGARGPGSGVTFEVRTGPATLLSLSPIAQGWRMAWATGEIEESRYASLETPNAMFRFDRGHSVEACEAWTSSGASHHAAVAAGRLDVELPALGSAAQIELVRV
jgi:L-fucose isomerase-like protein